MTDKAYVTERKPTPEATKKRRSLFRSKWRAVAAAKRKAGLPVIIRSR